MGRAQVEANRMQAGNANMHAQRDRMQAEMAQMKADRLRGVGEKAALVAQMAPQAEMQQTWTRKGKYQMGLR
jgi:hypothetical protein